MHIPDGYLNAVTSAGTFFASGAAGVIASKKIRESIEEERIPLFGVTAALIFAAQMVNFPIIGGTSGHLLGGVLASLIAGPFGGFFIMTSVLIVQALVFADGGITALGANILNMAVIGSMLSYYIYRFFIKSKLSQYISIALASWLSVVLASIACSIEIWLSGHANLQIVLPSMAGIHAVIGIGEAVITLGIVKALSALRSDLFATIVSGGVKNE